MRTSLLNLPQQIFLFIRQAKDELKKVAWPSRQQTIRDTAVVVVSSVLIGGIIGGIDYLFTLLIEYIIQTYGG